MGKKTQFYVPDSVQHHTKESRAFARAAGIDWPGHGLTRLR
jgi:hypothetical protein